MSEDNDNAELSTCLLAFAYGIVIAYVALVTFIHWFMD